MSTQAQDRADYWKRIYAGQQEQNRLTPPSQFAAFIINEISRDTTVFDIGCGNGRDSLFFAQYGHKVFGFDQALPAITLAQDRAAKWALTQCSFHQAETRDDIIYNKIAKASDTSVCVYARFFLHAITEEEQAAFFQRLGTCIMPGSTVAFEFRTVADAESEKVAGLHYRRFQTLESVVEALDANGFSLLYAEEGVGFAKHQTEDAVVGRCHLVKR